MSLFRTLTSLVEELQIGEERQNEIRSLLRLFRAEVESFKDRPETEEMAHLQKMRNDYEFDEWAQDIINDRIINVQRQIDVNEAMAAAQQRSAILWGAILSDNPLESLKSLAGTEGFDAETETE